MAAVAAGGVTAWTLAGAAPPAHGKYGDPSAMELPSYIEYLIEKNTRPDASGALYRGTDPAVLLRRLLDAQGRLAEVGPLAGQKKWTQINGIVTGPLGTLSVTLNQIAATAAEPSSSVVREAARKVKSDVLGIGQAADKKDGEGCVRLAGMATQDLKALLQVAFD
jgi:hypothetical protein